MEGGKNSIALLRREPERVLQLAETARALAAERGYAYEVAIATILHGWAPATLGQRDDGVQRLREGLDAHRASGAGADHSYFLALLADASGGEEGLVTIKEAFETVDPDRPFFFDAELHRLHGELTLAVLR